MTMDLQEKSTDDLVAMLQETQHRVDTLVQSASDIFKQSELAEWDESLYQKGRELLAESRKLFEETTPVAEEVERRIGPEVIQELGVLRGLQLEDLDQRWYRRDLTTQTVPAGNDIDDSLPDALENLISMVPISWWRRQQSLLTEERRKTVLRPLQLCGRERWAPDLTTIHRYAYYLSVADDHLEKKPLLDMYTSARAVPQICSLGMALEYLKKVKGAEQKLRELWKAPSAETDARFFELLVAAAFARMGHDVEFLETSATKTPDLRIHGMTVPLVVECKRRQALNTYEAMEFSTIRGVFANLRAMREELGLVGELDIEFKQQINQIPGNVIEQTIRDLTKSLSPYADVETEWGNLHLKPLEVSKHFEPTRLYSPEFLRDVFDIDLELDEFDGICAIAKNSQAPVVDRADLPFLLKWTSVSEAAIERKLQTIRNLWIEAVEQIPTGEAGLIYLAYEEGHRPTLADKRTDTIRNLASTIYFKRRAISVPMTVILRLLPNLILEGRPDFIESAIPLVSGERAEFEFWAKETPINIFVPHPKEGHYS